MNQYGSPRVATNGAAGPDFPLPPGHSSRPGTPPDLSFGHSSRPGTPPGMSFGHSTRPATPPELSMGCGTRTSHLASPDALGSMGGHVDHRAHQGSTHPQQGHGIRGKGERVGHHPNLGSTHPHQGHGFAAPDAVRASFEFVPDGGAVGPTGLGGRNGYTAGSQGVTAGNGAGGSFKTPMPPMAFQGHGFYGNPEDAPLTRACHVERVLGQLSRSRSSRRPYAPPALEQTGCHTAWQESPGERGMRRRASNSRIDDADATSASRGTNLAKANTVDTHLLNNTPMPGQGSLARANHANANRRSPTSGSQTGMSSPEEAQSPRYGNNVSKPSPEGVSSPRYSNQLNMPTHEGVSSRRYGNQLSMPSPEGVLSPRGSWAQAPGRGSERPGPSPPPLSRGVREGGSRGSPLSRGGAPSYAVRPRDNGHEASYSAPQALTGTQGPNAAAHGEGRESRDSRESRETLSPPGSQGTPPRITVLRKGSSSQVPGRPRTPNSSSSAGRMSRVQDHRQGGAPQDEEEGQGHWQMGLEQGPAGARHGSSAGHESFAAVTNEDRNSADGHQGRGVGRSPQGRAAERAALEVLRGAKAPLHARRGVPMEVLNALDSGDETENDTEDGARSTVDGAARRSRLPPRSPTFGTLSPTSGTGSPTLGKQSPTSGTGSPVSRHHLDRSPKEGRELRPGPGGRAGPTHLSSQHLDRGLKEGIAGSMLLSSGQGRPRTAETGRPRTPEAHGMPPRSPQAVPAAGAEASGAGSHGAGASGAGAHGAGSHGAGTPAPGSSIRAPVLAISPKGAGAVLAPLMESKQGHLPRPSSPMLASHRGAAELGPGPGSPGQRPRTPPSRVAGVMGRDFGAGVGPTGERPRTPPPGSVQGRGAEALHCSSSPRGKVQGRQVRRSQSYRQTAESPWPLGQSVASTLASHRAGESDSWTPDSAAWTSDSDSWQPGCDSSAVTAWHQGSSSVAPLRPETVLHEGGLPSKGAGPLFQGSSGPVHRPEGGERDPERYRLPPDHQSSASERKSVLSKGSDGLPRGTFSLEQQGPGPRSWGVVRAAFRQRRLQAQVPPSLYSGQDQSYYSEEGQRAQGHSLGPGEEEGSQGHAPRGSGGALADSCFAAEPRSTGPVQRAQMSSQRPPLSPRPGPVGTESGRRAPPISPGSLGGARKHEHAESWDHQQHHHQQQQQQQQRPQQKRQQEQEPDQQQWGYREHEEGHEECEGSTEGGEGGEGGEEGCVTQEISDLRRMWLGSRHGSVSASEHLECQE